MASAVLMFNTTGGKSQLHAVGCQAIRTKGARGQKFVITSDAKHGAGAVEEAVADITERGYEIVRCKCLK